MVLDEVELEEELELEELLESESLSLPGPEGSAESGEEVRCCEVGQRVGCLLQLD